MIGAAAFVYVSMIASMDLDVNPRFEMGRPIPSLPSVMFDVKTSSYGIAHQRAKSERLQARILWIDATANLERFGSEEKIVDLLARIKDSGFNTVVLDVKPISGQVIYPSAYAPKIESWKEQTLDKAFDPVGPVVREAKRHGLSLFFSLNAFSEGHSLFKEGPGYDHPEWQSVIYDARPMARIGEANFAIHPKANELGAVGHLSLFNAQDKVPAAVPGRFAVTVDVRGRVVDGFEDGGAQGAAPTIPKFGFLLVGQGSGAEFLRRHAEPGHRLFLETEAHFVPMAESGEKQYPLMTNPNSPIVRERALNIVRELMDRYPEVDGLMYDDRYRYAGISGDFSPESREGFERHLGKKVQWPEDVFTFTVNPNLERGLRPGPYYDAWMSWRAQRMTDFLGEVRETVQGRKKQLGLYVGSWYGEYPAFGNNYASRDVKAGFWFLTDSYRKTGLARQVDFLITGCYYPTATIYDALTINKGIGATVEGSAALTNRLVRSDTWTYAGVMLSQFAGYPEGLERALQAACGASQGVMVFDLSHNIDPFWEVFKRAFAADPRLAPHQRMDVLEAARATQSSLDKQGVQDPPIPILSGTAGTGL